MDHAIFDGMFLPTAGQPGWTRRAAPLLFLALLTPTGSEGAGGEVAARFTTRNDSTYTIRAVYACDPRAATWGPNRIQGRVLSPRQQASIELREGCGVYDLRFVADDGIEFLEDEVPFCGEDAEAALAARTAGAADDADDVVTLGAGTLEKTRRARSGR